MYNLDPIYPKRQSLPTMYDLPSEDPEEDGLPDEFHDTQPQILKETCRSPVIPDRAMFIGTDLNLYYDSQHPLWHKRPDWFLVLGVASSSQQQEMRWSYVIWEESVDPFLVVELLSPGTEADDLGQNLREVNQPPTKWQVYEQVLRIPYYVLFDRYVHEFRLFRLEGTRYQAVDISGQGYWFEELGLGLGVWSGWYDRHEGQWLRWYTRSGEWVPTLAEQVQAEQQRAEDERQRAEDERQRAEDERQRADRLATKLRELGINPDDL
jgi:Uma2 family endonuclease